MDKGNVNKHRTSMSGLKVQEESKWGANKAAERYGNLRQPDMTAKDACYPQKLGDENNLQGPRYMNKHRQDWIVGAGESAEGKPGYVPGYKGKR